jgi:hypothetical protein
MNEPVISAERNGRKVDPAECLRNQMMIVEVVPAST